MGIVVGEGAQAVEFFLAGGVPKGEFDMDIVDEDVWGCGEYEGGLRCREESTMDVVF